MSQPMTAKKLAKLLRSLANPEIAQHSQRFFKAGPGGYGEGDKFLGIRVPMLRKHAKAHRAIALEQIQLLLMSSFHEERLLALLLLVGKFAKADEDEKFAIYRLYLSNTHYINNWDLVDSSAHHIVGAYLQNRDRKVLYQLAQSASLWERRIAILATLKFIHSDQFEDTLNIASLLINDTQDLIHKAVGWMLREVGKRDVGVEKEFLAAHCQTMPRTMLRYAIEKFPEPERKRYLAGRV